MGSPRALPWVKPCPLLSLHKGVPEKGEGLEPWVGPHWRRDTGSGLFPKTGRTWRARGTVGWAKPPGGCRSEFRCSAHEVAASWHFCLGGPVG